LTKKQNQVWQAIQELVNREGRFPTVREIARAAGLSSPATVQAYLERLAERGVLLRRGRAWKPASAGRQVPLVGVVPAGSPLEVFEGLGEAVELPAWMAEKTDDILALRVRGDSMKDAYIQEGDLVVIRRAGRAEAGEMVVARLDDGSITLKRLKKEGAAFFLAPENPDYSPIHAAFELVGRVVGVLRKYR